MPRGDLLSSGKQPWHTGHLALLQPQERLGVTTSCFNSLVDDPRCWLWQSTRVLFFPSAFSVFMVGRMDKLTSNLGLLEADEHDEETRERLNHEQLIFLLSSLHVLDRCQLFPTSIGMCPSL